MEAQLDGKKYSFILDPTYRGESWAAPKGKDGKIDHHAALSGDDLRDFVNAKLFPHLHGFKQQATGPNTIKYKIGEMFGEIKSRIQSGYDLREVIDHVDELRFRSQTEKHELSHLYEAKIKNMGNAGRNGGEYSDIQEKDRFNVVLANPPFGSKERPELQQNFPIRTGETAFLFLQHLIKILKAGGTPRHCHREHLPLQHRQCLCEPAQAPAGKLQPPHRARLPRRQVPRREREDRRLHRLGPPLRSSSRGLQDRRSLEATP